MVMGDVIFIYLAIVAGIISVMNAFKAYVLSDGFTKMNNDILHFVNYSLLDALVCGINLGMYYV